MNGFLSNGVLHEYNILKLLSWQLLVQVSCRLIPLVCKDRCGDLVAHSSSSNALLVLVHPYIMPVDNGLAYPLVSLCLVPLQPLNVRVAKPTPTSYTIYSL